MEQDEQGHRCKAAQHDVLREVQSVRIVGREGEDEVGQGRLLGHLRKYITLAD